MHHTKRSWLGWMAAAGLTILGAAGGCEKQEPAAAPSAAPAPKTTETTGAGAAAEPARPAETPSGAAADASGGVIQIGHYGSMTGKEATFGQSTDNGIRLAVKEFNAAGGLNGRKVEVITYDTKGESSEAGKAVTRLVTSDKVTAVLGEVASTLSLAGGAVCQEKGVPMISPSSTNPAVTRGRDYVFRVCFIDPFQGFVVAKFAHENLKARKVAVLYDQAQTYSKGLRDEFKKHFTAMGGTISADEAYSSGDQDFSAQLGQIRAGAPDAIFVPGYYTEAGNIALQARKLGIKAPLLGGDGWDSEQLAKIGGEAIEGCYYSNHYAPDQKGELVAAFVSKYQSEYGATPDGLAALGYDAANILFDAMKRARSLGGKDLRDAIAQTSEFKAVTGTISLDQNRDAQKSAVVVEMKGGKPVFAAIVEPTKK